MAVNVVVLEGRLTHDVELRQTTSGVSVCSFSIAVDRNYKSGEERLTDFLTIQAWRPTAEFIGKYFKKGDGIAVVGRMQSRKYTDNNGNNRTAVEVVAENVSFPLGRNNSNVANTANNAAPGLSNDFSNFMNDDDANLGDSDLPF